MSYEEKTLNYSYFNETQALDKQVQIKKLQECM